MKLAALASYIVGGIFCILGFVFWLLVSFLVSERAFNSDAIVVWQAIFSLVMVLIAILALWALINFVFNKLWQRGVIFGLFSLNILLTLPFFPAVIGVLFIIFGLLAACSRLDQDRTDHLTFKPWHILTPHFRRLYLLIVLVVSVVVFVVFMQKTANGVDISNQTKRAVKTRVVMLVEVVPMNDFVDKIVNGFSGSIYQDLIKQADDLRAQGLTEADIQRTLSATQEEIELSKSAASQVIERSIFDYVDRYLDFWADRFEIIVAQNRMGFGLSLSVLVYLTLRIIKFVFVIPSIVMFQLLLFIFMRLKIIRRFVIQKDAEVYELYD